MFEALKKWKADRKTPHQNVQRMLLAVADYRAGENSTIAADLFKMGEGGEIEHGGDTYVYQERKVQLFPYVMPTWTFQIIRRERDDLQVNAGVIHKLILEQRGLPAPAYPKFKKLPSWFWILWIIAISVVGLFIVLPLILIAGLLMRVYWWLEARFYDGRSYKQDLISDDEAMRIARDPFGYRERSRDRF